jgi:uncharacterized protein (TIGR04255 family)
MAQYAVPPIVDAVIELRFETPIDDAVRGQLARKLSGEYPLVERNEVRQFQLDVASGEVEHSTEERIEKYTSAEEPRGLQIGTHIFSVFAGAPYEGWESLVGRFSKAFAVAKKEWGFRKIERVGVRYINRLDLSENSQGQVDYEDYLNLRINLPETFPPIHGYTLSFETSLKDYDCLARVQSNVTDPSVPGKHSFVLDIDVWRSRDIPQKEDGLYEFLETMRQAKNMLFETFITDLARDTFDAR